MYRSDAFQVLAPAKINLHLAVSTQRTDDGRHRLQSVFHTVDLCDVLVFSFSDEGSFGVHGAHDVHGTPMTEDISLESGLEPMDVPQEENLVVKALRALADRYGRPLPSVKIGLDKVIPAQAGLGGGSSDAAAALLALARFWNLDPLGPECLEVAGNLGSDIAFFLHGGCALMSGDGSTLERVLPALSGCPVALIKPVGGVPTGACYRSFDENPPAAEAPDGLIAALEDSDVPAAGRLLANNLAPSACSLLPGLEEALGWLASQPGVLGSQLTGSGSAAFALCDSPDAAVALAKEAKKQGLWSYAGALTSQGVTLL